MIVKHSCSLAILRNWCIAVGGEGLANLISGCASNMEVVDIGARDHSSVSFLLSDSDMFNLWFIYPNKVKQNLDVSIAQFVNIYIPCNC